MNAYYGVLETLCKFESLSPFVIKYIKVLKDNVYNAFRKVILYTMDAVGGKKLYPSAPCQIPVHECIFEITFPFLKYIEKKKDGTIVLVFSKLDKSHLEIPFDVAFECFLLNEVLDFIMNYPIDSPITEEFTFNFSDHKIVN